jgi:hypothetical protein
MLAKQLDSLDAWLPNKLPGELSRPPLKEHIETLAQIRGQDLEPDPSGGGRTRVRQGVAPERRVSIEDPEMRHGRKSKTKLFHGYKRHIGVDLDTTLVLACAVTPANRPEEEAAPTLKADIDRQERAIGDQQTIVIRQEFVLTEVATVRTQPNQGTTARSHPHLVSEGRDRLNAGDHDLPSTATANFDESDRIRLCQDKRAAIPRKLQPTQMHWGSHSTPSP